ncbi:ABC transporter permease [Vibrio sp. WXL103]|uniref:ABC transporter permease n=1 Tax=Vibrio sp. WXL103 TaxID=3450710 RepID=UPI003EC6D333
MKLPELIRQEWVSLVRNPVVVVVVFFGVLFYSFLYPLPYAQQTPTEQKLVIVNLDNSQISYTLERMIDATQQIRVIERVASIEAAKQKVVEKKAAGLIVIPEHFYKDLLLGKSPTLAYAGDASYFLVYGAIVEGLAHSGATLGAQVKVAQSLSSGQPISMAGQQHSVVSLNSKPTFNAGMGYVSYVVPAVFVLILQQTLVMAGGLMVATQRGSEGYWNKVPASQLLLARTLVLVGVYYLLAMFYFGASFEMYGISKVAQAGQVLTMLLPFLIGCCLLGYVLGHVVPRRGWVSVLVLLSSMPLIFVSGFIWPVELIPVPLLLLADLFPSTVAIKAFLSLNQIGADWSQVGHYYFHLWLICAWWLIFVWFQVKSLRSFIPSKLVSI